VAKFVTVSLGVCCKPAGVDADQAGSAETLMRKTDAQLYLAKARGRHQACGAQMNEG
jgi:GGDEF domain-containing protein